MDGILWNFIFLNIFRKSVERIQFSLNLARITDILHEDLCTLIISRSILVRMRNVSDKIVEKSKYTFYVP